MDRPGPTAGAPPPAAWSGRVFDPLVDGRDAVEAILDRELLLLQLLDRHRVRMRPLHDPLDLFIQMPMVALQTLSFHLVHLSDSAMGVLERTASAP